MPTPISVQSPTRKTPSFEDWFVTSDGSMMKTGSNKPRLSLLTDIDKKYPGFPTSLSPTLSAKKWFPSPLSESDSGVRTPFPALSEANSTSPTSIRDGASRCRSRDDLRYDHMASIDNIIKQDLQGLESEIDHGGFSTESSPSDCPPCRVTSPRTALARSSFYIHCEYGAANNMLPQDPAGSYLMRRELVRSPVSSIEVEPRHNCMTTMSKPYIEIANGTEASTTSPLSPSGTVLAYTSRRPVYSGLLGVSPLSETQVAEYRFWRPCPHRSCAFGCGRAYDGELAAAKRLFRPVEEPSPEKESTPDGNRPAVRGMRNTGRYGYDKRRISPTCGGKRSEIGTSSWAGRRLVSNWDNFLVRCERDGVASY